MNDKSVKAQKGETFEQYCHRVAVSKDALKLTWEEVAKLINEQYDTQYSADKYRKQERRYKQCLQDDGNLPFLSAEADNEDEEEKVINTAEEAIDHYKIERLKLMEERTQINAMYRRISREETLKEIAREAVESLKDCKLNFYSRDDSDGGDCAGILVISDWHYGIDINSYFNKYNPEIAKERIATLTTRTEFEIWNRGVRDLYVVNLGDLICGNIHQKLRLSSRIDVITQIMQVSELVAQMLAELSKFANIHYCDTLDNHSRIEPNIKDSLELESLARLTKWYLKERLPEVDYIDNTYGDDVVDFEVMGHKVIGVHGHKDKPTKVIDGLSMLTHNHYDLVLTAHLHHFSADEKNDTLCISNASLMGTDQYAQDLRLSSQPSQNLIIVTKDCVAQEIIRILV